MAVCVLSACADRQLTEVQPPEPGELAIRLSAVEQEVGAVLLSLRGPSVSGDLAPAQAGSVIAVRAAGSTVTIGIFGSLGSGDLAHFHVPDVARVSEYKATLLQVADRSNARRPQTDYRVTIGRK